MYEANFGLKRRPFAATPDATCFLSAGPIQSALDEVVVCIEQGQGIAVVTAPAGVGKTLLCERLCLELSERFQVVFLRHSSFLTRRALLQTLLSELDHPYQHPSEQELRLELLPAIRELRDDKEALVVICDEAHHLPDSLLEELRILADYAEAGRPLVRLVLAGQLGLEDKLAQPGLEAFNQRIRAHVNLPTFDRMGSLDYIDYRLTWGGGRTEELFTPAALDVIARASDGVARCINQLADHSLLLAFVAEQRPVTEEIVLEALNDLRRLPLHWNEPLRSSSETTPRHDQDNLVTEESERTFEVSTREPVKSSVVYSYEPTGDETSSNAVADTYSSVEFGAEIMPGTSAASPESVEAVEVSLHELEPLHPGNEIRVDVTGSEWRDALGLFAAAKGAVKAPAPAPADHHSNSMVESPQSHSIVAPQSEISVSAADVRVKPVQAVDPSKDGFDEELVIDRYATIDAGLPPISVADIPKPIEVRPVVSAVVAIAESEPIRASHDSHLNHIAEDDFSELDGDLEPLSDEEFAEVESDMSDRTIQHLDDVLGTVRGLIDIVAEHVAESSSERLDPPHPVAAPKGGLEGTEDTLLKSLRRDEVSSRSTSQAASVRSHESETESHWASVETEAVEPTAAQRPFRNLFSMLRRKQQQSR